MAKKTVVEIVCDRCERTEYVSPEELRAQPDLKISLGFESAPGDLTTPAAGVEVQFNELCSSCKKTVKNLFSSMTKKINWKRNKEEETEIEVATEG